jgi:hypothetical protein
VQGSERGFDLQRDQGSQRQQPSAAARQLSRNASSGRSQKPAAPAYYPTNIPYMTKQISSGRRCVCLYVCVRACACVHACT